MQLYVFVSTFNIFVFKDYGALFVDRTSEEEVWSLPRGKYFLFFFFFLKRKTLGVDHVGVVGDGKGKKKYLALVRNGGLNHLLKIFNDISVFLV